MKRQHNEKHLAFIRQLPCLICGDNTATEAAHVRFSDATAGKRQTGMGEKPDDAFTVPLCGGDHRVQHAMGEKRFWHGRDPIRIALALWRVSGDSHAGEQIVRANQHHT